MEQKNKLKIFVSYAHEDEAHVGNFEKYLSPLLNDGSIDFWYDRKIRAGESLQNKIDVNLDNADIVCLLISAESLSSNACIQERETALGLNRKKGITVIPIILSECGWLDCKEISSLLALPTDGKPISSFPSIDKAWKNVYNKFKTVIEYQRTIKSIENTGDFLNFLNDAESLTKASAHKEAVALTDIFIYPELMKFDDLGEHERKIDSQKLIESLPDNQRVLISGENQSGKTTLCKIIFMFLRRQGFIPVYVSGKNDNYKGLMRNRISGAFKKQYENISADEIDERKIIPILDDFHLARNKEKHIESLSSYGCCVLTVDDISSLNFRDEFILKSFSQFSIREFSPSLRNQLIEKWVTLTDRDGYGGNKMYVRIDGVSELVDTSLGKVIGDGIMPAYPFFILSIITIHENFKPLEEITSQGYCYQALIYIYLRKSGVANDEIDTYINFLTEFSFFFFESGKSELSGNDFDSFMKSYLEKYNFPVELDILMRNLQET
uniref:TIR domain-containing protein n=1 Tax=Candidatus Kentrum sp. LPFa TaxID=2126335 RepID=A0A450WQD2_9GAMM|nr:MAG: TIR domain-containing protein [Candidatus Kentron sp. LPFa]